MLNCSHYPSSPLISPLSFSLSLPLSLTVPPPPSPPGQGSVHRPRQGAVAQAVRGPGGEVQEGDAQQPRALRGQPGLPGAKGLQQHQQQLRRLPQHDHVLGPVQQGKNHNMTMS